jgi:hypothetical protein
MVKKFPGLRLRLTTRVWFCEDLKLTLGYSMTERLSFRKITIQGYVKSSTITVPPMAFSSAPCENVRCDSVPQVRFKIFKEPGARPQNTNTCFTCCSARTSHIYFDSLPRASSYTHTHARVGLHTGFPVFSASLDLNLIAVVYRCLLIVNSFKVFLSL